MTKIKKSPAFDLSPVKKSGMRELHPLDGALLLMHFAFRGLVVKADLFLESQGLSRVHHRILYAIVRTEGLSIGGLQDLLGVSKQALHKPLKHLQEEGYVIAERDVVQHRTKLLHLTPKGVRLEQAASDHERKAIQDALGTVSPSQQRVWMEIMTALARNA
ncbi:MAG: transcriptional regulator [Burkholderiales bacterium RIFCSPLOWO2_02_FULL_57_36]|nr:MAG: transcriptional regulator [Burkholderiales bacterium RIFCSPLOWO2_02_FULL_57_36]